VPWEPRSWRRALLNDREWRLAWPLLLKEDMNG
jgi:hypothetical protein